jgi:hypothetical protein
MRNTEPRQPSAVRGNSRRPLGIIALSPTGSGWVAPAFTTMTSTGPGSARAPSAVSFNKLEFGNTKGSSNGRVVIPGVNDEIPDYHYVNRG